MVNSYLDEGFSEDFGDSFESNSDYKGTDIEDNIADSSEELFDDAVEDENLDEGTNQLMDFPPIQEIENDEESIGEQVDINDYPEIIFEEDGEGLRTDPIDLSDCPDLTDESLQEIEGEEAENILDFPEIPEQDNFEEEKGNPIEILDFPSIEGEDDIGTEQISISENPSLQEYAEQIEATDSADELRDIRERLLNGEYSDSTNSLAENINDDDISEETRIESDFEEDYLEETSLEPEYEEGIKESYDHLTSQDLREQLDAYIAENLAQNEIEENQIDEFDDEDGDGDIKVLTREITPEIIEGRERDMEEVLDNYRENLRDRDIPDEKIEEFIDNERGKMLAEYESLDNGDTSENIYYTPMDFDSVVEDLRQSIETSGNEDIMDHDIDNIIQENGPELEEELFTENDTLSEQTNDIEDTLDLSEYEIDYEAIYNASDNENISEAFEDIDLNADSVRLDTSLDSFIEDNWDELSIDGKKESMRDLADYIVDTIGFENPPQIEFYNNPRMGDYGGYSSSSNTLRVNEYMLYDNLEAADTVAHELWHAHQRECANHPQSIRDIQYQFNFDNYISPDLGHELYENQLIEAEARAFAGQIKERLKSMEDLRFRR